jgi:uncharacterized protein
MSIAAQQIAKRLFGKFSSHKPPQPSAKFRVIDMSSDTELASEVEIADTSAKRSKGLLGRNGLAPGEGLWIVPCESVHTFWMRFAIDLIYLDRLQRIRKIRKSVAPWRISVCLSAHSVIELPAGTIRDQDVHKGHQIKLFPIEVEEQPVEINSEAPE